MTDGYNIDGSHNSIRYTLPPSYFLGQKTHAHLQKEKETVLCECDWRRPDVSLEEIVAWRKCIAEKYHYVTEKYLELFKVKTYSEEMAGVYTDIVEPKSGVPEENSQRVLINFHGGAFLVQGRLNWEAFPIAALANTKVVSVDYRMAPEYEYPAATVDAVAVYKSLLKDYAPENIGIYGCSAGAILTAQTVAMLQQQGLPLPGAVGLLSAGAHKLEGDSNYFVSAQLGMPEVLAMDQLAYFKSADLDDPLVTPGVSDEVMRNFPPTLNVASTRDYFLSSVVQTHTQLTRLNVVSDLHIWEGLDHGFHVNYPGIEESHEVYRVIVKFFEQHLG